MTKDDIIDLNKRPAEVTTAFEKHRHYQWDFTMTTPNISMIPDWIKDCIDTCYRHKSKENILPLPYFKRRISVRQHDASVNGSSIASCEAITTTKIPVKVHELYQSTETGSHSKNIAKDSPVSIGGLIFFGAFSSLIIYFLFNSASTLADSERFSSITGKDKGNVSLVSDQSITKSSSVVSADKSGFFSSKVVNSFVPDVTNKKWTSYPLPYNADGIFINGALKMASSDKYYYMFALLINGETKTISQKQLIRLGYKVFNGSYEHVVIKKLTELNTYVVLMEPISKTQNRINSVKLSQSSESVIQSKRRFYEFKGLDSMERRIKPSSNVDI